MKQVNQEHNLYSQLVEISNVKNDEKQLENDQVMMKTDALILAGTEKCSAHNKLTRNSEKWRTIFSESSSSMTITMKQTELTKNANPARRTKMNTLDSF